MEIDSYDFEGGDGPLPGGHMPGDGEGGDGPFPDDEGGDIILPGGAQSVEGKYVVYFVLEKHGDGSIMVSNILVFDETKKTIEIPQGRDEPIGYTDPISITYEPMLKGLTTKTESFQGKAANVFKNWNTAEGEKIYPGIRDTKEFIAKYMKTTDVLEVYIQRDYEESPALVNVARPEELPPTPVSKVVYFNGNGGTCEAPALGAETTSSKYRFDGWKREDGLIFQPDSSFTTNKNWTMRGMWTFLPGQAKEVELTQVAYKKALSDEISTISFNANGGECSTKTLEVKKMTDYSFKGWYTAPEKGKKVTVVKDADYKEISPNTFKCEVYAQYNKTERVSSVVLPQAIREDHIFRGWAKTPDAKEGETGVYNTFGNTTLYAIWEEIKKDYLWIKDENGKWVLGTLWIKDNSGKWSKNLNIWVKGSGGWSKVD